RPAVGPLSAPETVSGPGPVIRFEDVSLTRQGRTALEGVSLTLTEPRVALIGANGSGKSTLARCIIGLDKPTAGRVEVNGL
ncbi:ATP-binding cassette domain-containing protein, partial [Pseudomonas protegens]|nr:ATP-binding cassette domain-containing protein [Pseudomonas protegens]